MIHSWRHLDRVSRLTCGSSIMARSIGIRGKKVWGNLGWRRPFPYGNNLFHTTNYARGKHSPITKGMDRAEMRGGTKDVIVSRPANDDLRPTPIMEKTRHRDGSIYKSDRVFRRIYRIADRDQTRLEPMMFSEPTNCYPDRDTCSVHFPSFMMQIYSLKLAKIPVDVSSVQLYGYIAVRDERDSMLNYVVNHSRDVPITLEQGSFIEMTGPKRGISMCCAVLLEFDMRIKKGENEEDDLQLIDGAIEYSELTIPWKPFTNRISGDFGAVDITLALVHRAVEATIEIVISEVKSGFSLSLSSLVFINELHQEIQLFRGTIGESCGLRRFVVAVLLDTWMHLVFKVGQNGSTNGVQRYCSFKANIHGYVDQQIVLELASISVKVAWSTFPW